MISTLEARDTILKHITRLPAERMPILEAQGRVLAEEVKALRKQPPWDNSAMDGYAVRASDLVGASRERPAELRVVDSIMAGQLSTRPLEEGEAARIMTGAPLPPGADTVIRQEDAVREGERVSILVAAKEGRDVRRAGDDQNPGDVLLTPGTLIRPAEIGMLAGAPRLWVEAYRVPTVAIVATGDELVEPDEPCPPEKIVNTASYALAALVKEAGGIPKILPVARDNEESLREVLAATRGLDAVLTVGGVSVGERDFVRRVFEEGGVDVKFWKVQMTPGKPLAFGLRGTVPFFMLPGNPTSSMVSFECFVRPALLKLAGRERIFRRTLKAELTEMIRKRPGYVHFLRVKLTERDGRWYAASAGNQSSGVLGSMSRADGLAVGPEAPDRLEAGQQVVVMPLDDQLGMTLEREV